MKNIFLYHGSYGSKSIQGSQWPDRGSPQEPRPKQIAYRRLSRPPWGCGVVGELVPEVSLTVPTPDWAYLEGPPVRPLATHCLATSYPLDKIHDFYQLYKWIYLIPQTRQLNKKSVLFSSQAIDHSPKSIDNWCENPSRYDGFIQKCPGTAYLPLHIEAN